jgi:hypothetical protein
MKIFVSTKSEKTRKTLRLHNLSLFRLLCLQCSPKATASGGGSLLLFLYRTNVTPALAYGANVARLSLPKQSPVYKNFRSKGDCRAAKEQDRRLAMT